VTAAGFFIAQGPSRNAQTPVKVLSSNTLKGFLTGGRFRVPALPVLIGAAAPSQQNFEATQETMKNTKFVVNVVHGTRAAQYVQRIEIEARPNNPHT
jgi:hypothetical protein